MHNLQAFYNESFFGIFHADTMGMAVYANRAWTEITGLVRERSLGYGWLEAIHPGDRERVLADWQHASMAGRALDVSLRIVRPDNSRRYVRVRGRPMPNDTGEDDCYVGVVLDMTEQVLAERRLRRNNELLSAVLENIPCGITVFDADGSLLLDNQRFRELLLLPDNPPDGSITDFGTVAVDRALPSFGSSDTGSQWSARSDVDTAPRVREEMQPDGRVLEVRDAPMPTGGIVTTYTDITQHRQIIETLQHAKTAAEQAAAAKAAFLATMSHEIRTPMNGVIGMTNVLLERGLSSDQRDIVEVIRQSGESLLVVINDILDYSKIESGQMELEWLPLRLQDVVDNSVRLLSSKAEQKGVTLVVTMDSDIPSLVQGDRNRLQQVLVNLISNAVKFTEAGEIRISVRNSSSDTPHASPEVTGDVCTLTVTVEDTGIGIAREKLDSIFEPFVQADSSTARRFGGTGLGLAIARRLVEAMGGSMKIESEAGVGTTVRFSFLAEVAVPRSLAASDGEAPLLGKRVLLVSGRRSDVGVLVQQLKRWGMHCRTCLGTSEALSILAKPGEFDLVLAAAHQVDTRGVDFVRALRAASVATPAVLLSRKRLAEALDPELCAFMVPRSSSESSLYDAMVTAVHHDETGAGEDPPVSQFDESLAERAPLRILIAEDNEINRRVALRMLGGFGYKADVAHNGTEVIKAVRERAYDLVLMDIQMPQVDGIEATRFIVKKLPPEQRPRVVAMSANVMREHVEAALDAGADDYIAKPFSPAELRAALEHAAYRKSRKSIELPDGRTSERQVLSLGRVRSHLRGDASGGFLRDLIATFSRTSEEILSRLRSAVRNRNAAEVRAILHEYAGMCAVIGAEKLLRLTQELQKFARDGSLSKVESLMNECETVHEESVAALLAVVEGQRAKRLPAGVSLRRKDAAP